MANGASNQGGVIPRMYKSGSIIYFEGDRSEYIYILKSGRVVLSSTKLDTGEEVKEEVKKGEFFGVKSALGKYPREETAQTIGETVVLIFTLADFERLILRNVNVVQKMLRVFSNQLRRIGKMVRSVLGEGENVNPDIELFKIGEYYYNAGAPRHAEYVFKKYMEHYPDTEQAAVAMQRIKAIASGQTGKPEAGMSVLDETPDSDLGEFNFEETEEVTDMVDFNEKSTGDQTDLSSELDDFLTGNGATEDFDDFTFGSSREPESIESVYDEAKSMISRKNYPEALSGFEKIMALDEIKDGDSEWYERAHFEAGQCMFMLGQKKEAVQLLISSIKKFSNSDEVKNALYVIGEIFESINQRDKALAYFNKVASLGSGDMLTQKAIRKTKQLQNG